MRLLLAILLSAAALPAQLPDGVISGTVRSATNHKPLEDAEVSLIGETSTGAQTDPQGAFRFDHLLPGNYALNVQKSGYIGTEPIKADPGSKPLLVELYPLPHIEGRVLDENGDPAPGVIVEGVPYVRGATSAKDGGFLLTNLWPRDYVIRLWIPASLRSAGYPAVEYYPGVTDAAQAAPIQVTQGAQIGGFDIRLHRVPLVDFHGRVVDLAKDDTAPVVEAALDCEPGPIEGSFARRPVDADGRFHFDRIPPGLHTLLLFRGTGSDDLPYTARVRVGKDEVTVPVPPWANLEGIVKSTAKTPWEGVLGVGLDIGLGSVPNGDGAWRHNVLPAEDGTFTLLHVPPGNWSLRLESNNLRADGRALRIASARFGADSVIGKPLTVAESGNPPIEIILSSEAGAIAGTVEPGAAPEGALVFAQPLDGGPVIPGNFAQAQPDGSFLIPDLLPGEYQVAAWGMAAARQGAFGPDCSQRASRVSVSNGQTATVKLKRCN